MIFPKENAFLLFKMFIRLWNSVLESNTSLVSRANCDSCLDNPVHCNVLLYFFLKLKNFSKLLSDEAHTE